MLDNLTKEERFLFLRNEMTYDPMYMSSMDEAYHHSLLHGVEYFEYNFKHPHPDRINNDNRKEIRNSQIHK